MAGSEQTDQDQTERVTGGQHIPFGVFINYRRDDAKPEAGRLRDSLVLELGEGYGVFRDVDTLKDDIGLPWEERIELHLQRTDVMLILIGPAWLDELLRRQEAEEEEDKVREEIRAALERPGVRLIPLLVRGAKMPGRKQLPEDVARLASYEALEIHDGFFQFTVEHLGKVIRGVAETKARRADEEQATKQAEEQAGRDAEQKARAAAEEEAARKGAEEEEARLKAAEEEAERQAAVAERQAEQKIKEAYSAPPTIPTSTPAPAPATAPTWGNISDLLGATGLKFQEISPGTVAVPFHSERAENLVVMAKLLDKAVLLGVMLPKPAKRADEAALFNILRVAYQVNYVKAVAYESEDLAFGCEIPLSVLTPDVAEGCIRSLSVLGDVNKKDMVDQDGWGQRQMLANHAQGTQFKVDAEESRKAIRRSAEERGFTVTTAGDENLLLEMPIMGAESPPLKVVGFLTERVTSLVAGFGDLQPKGDKVQYMRRLLELSRIADVAKIGLDSTGDVSLMYEVPKVTPDLLGDVIVQFLPLTLGLLALEDQS